MYKKVGERQMVSGRKWLLNSSYAPLRGLGRFFAVAPTGCAVGYCLTPLTGLKRRSLWGWLTRRI